MAAKLSLDSFDKKILDCLQDDADMPLADLARRLKTLGYTDSEVILDAFLKRADKDIGDKAAGDVLGWVASSAMYFPPGKAPPAIKTAGDRLVEKHADHPAMVRYIQMLARGPDPRLASWRDLCRAACPPISRSTRPRSSAS